MTAKLCASEPVPAVVGTATIGRPGVRSGPSYSSSQTGTVVGGAEVDRLGRVHRRSAADRDDDRAGQAEVAQAAGAALDGRGRRVRLDLVEDRRSAGRPRRGRRGPARRSRPHGRPDRSRRRPASHRPRRPPRGVARSRPTPNSTRLRSVISKLPIGEACHISGPRPRVDRSCRAGPSASAGSRTRGTSARSSRRRGSRRSRPRRSRARRGR